MFPYVTVDLLGSAAFTPVQSDLKGNIAVSAMVRRQMVNLTRIRLS